MIVFADRETHRGFLREKQQERAVKYAIPAETRRIMKISTKTIVTVGMFTAVLSVLSILTIPMPTGVPVTLQTFAMALCGYVLGWKKGNIIHIDLYPARYSRRSGVCGNDRRTVLACRLQRRIYLGIHFPDNALRRGHGTEADLAPRAVRDLPVLLCVICSVSFSSPSWLPHRFRLLS